MRRVLVVLFAVMTLTACKKEVTIEKNLWKDGGEWNATSWKSPYNGTLIEGIGPENDFQSVVFRFNKDKNVTLVIEAEGDVLIYKMQYENTETELKFTNVIDQATDEIIYPTLVFSMTWEKDKLELKSASGFSGESETLLLEKKK